MVFKLYISHIAWALILAKLLVVGLSLPDALGAIAILASIHAFQVINYLFPRQPDLFKEVEAIKAELVRVDTLQRDVTALKLGAIRR